MKLVLVFFVAIWAAVSAVPFNSDGWFVPNTDGSTFWVSEKQSEELASIQPRATIDVKYYLYTKSNPKTPKQLYLNNAASLTNGGYDKSHPTRLLIHGWNGNYLSGDNIEVRNALLATGSYNVISVDWSSAAVTANYASARYSVSAVGKEVAGFIDFLNYKGGMSFSSLTVIGHSLGAHVAGFAAKQVTRGKVNVIIGLDPAYPLFSYSDCSARLCETDASYVESIQTNGGKLGFLQPIGKGAFYPNGGKSQPGCGTDASGSCAHARSWLYYSESILKNDFPSMKCSNYEAAVDKNCGTSYSTVRMGSPASYGSAGSYYVPVKSTSPYGMG